MENIQEEDKNTSTPSVEESPETKVEGEQDLLKTELERVKKVSKYTEEEKAEHTLKSTAKRLKEMGKDPAAVLGIKGGDETINNDEIPEWYKAEKAKETTKTALQLAEDITNETERELVIHYLNNRIVSTGNPKEDLRLARALANDVKNKQILEQISGKPTAKKVSAQGGAAPEVKEEEELTAEEMQFMKPPFNLSKEKILEARKNKGRKDVIEFQ